MGTMPKPVILSDRLLALSTTTVDRMLERYGERCAWPGCRRPALCSSGNLGGHLVCAEHFRITNGTARDDDDRPVDDRASRSLEDVLTDEDRARIDAAQDALEADLEDDLEDDADREDDA